MTTGQYFIIRSAPNKQAYNFSLWRGITLWGGETDLELALLGFWE